MEDNTEKKDGYLGSISIPRGHTLYEIDTFNKTVLPAKFESEEVFESGFLKETRRKLIIKEHCFYEPALNEKNARKKLLKKLLEKANKK